MVRVSSALREIKRLLMQDLQSYEHESTNKLKIFYGGRKIKLIVKKTAFDDEFGCDIHIPFILMCFIVCDNPFHVLKMYKMYRNNWKRDAVHTRDGSPLRDGHSSFRSGVFEWDHHLDLFEDRTGGQEEFEDRIASFCRNVKPQIENLLKKKIYKIMIANLNQKRLENLMEIDDLHNEIERLEDENAGMEALIIKLEGEINN